MLKEDGDSGHGTEKSSIVRKWKTQYSLDYYFNCSSSLNLSPIENCWQSIKQHIRKYPHWDDATLKELILEGWSHVTQDFINKQVSTMPDRL